MALPLLPIALGLGLILLLGSEKKAQAAAPAPSRPPQPGFPSGVEPETDCIPASAAALAQTLADSQMTPEQLGTFAVDLEVLGFPAAANCLRAILQGQSELNCVPAVAVALEHDIRNGTPEKLETYAVILSSAGMAGAANCLVAAAAQKRAGG
jgi:hypothetical protein